MSIREIINGRLGITLGFALGRTLPPGAAERIARWLSRRIAAQKNLELARAARVNQWVVHGESLNTVELDRAVAASFYNTILSIYRFYRYFRDPQALERMVEFPEKFSLVLNECLERKSGIIVTGVHLGNFDLVMQAMARCLPDLPGGLPLALSAPSPGKGYEWQNEFRRKSGLEVIPASLNAFKLAVRRLEEGGMVISGLDRPVAEARHKPYFFGHEAPVPVLHVPLGLRTNSPVVITGSITRPDGTAQVFISDLISMKSYNDRDQEILANAEAALEIAEGYIAQNPQHWAMYYPVWPQITPEMCP